MYQVNHESSFGRQFIKITKKNSQLKAEIIRVIKLLKNDPFNPSIKSHKVKIGSNLCYSSRVTGDIRIILGFNKNDKNVLDLLDLGGHSGKNKVYG